MPSRMPGGHLRVHHGDLPHGVVTDEALEYRLQFSYQPYASLEFPVDEGFLSDTSRRSEPHNGLATMASINSRKSFPYLLTDCFSLLSSLARGTS